MYISDQEQKGHLAQNVTFPTEEDFKKLDVNGDNVLSRKECRGSAFKLFCPPIKKYLLSDIIVLLFVVGTDSSVFLIK